MNVADSIREAAQYIHRMYDEPITVTDIAAHVFLSPSHFSFLFRTITGYTVKNYLNRYRMYRAAMDLKESNRRIITISYIHGFSSQQAFTKSFSQMYGIAPAQFRLLSPPFDPFPPENMWKEQTISMELKECFENVKFIHKDAFFVAGIEVDINYNTENGTSPISGAWAGWNGNNMTETLPDQTTHGVSYGITHSETAEDTGKYIVCAEVGTLSNLPVGLVGRRFGACDYAVFDTTLEIIGTGAFWRTFYKNWLPQSGYELPDESLHDNYCTFSRYPAIEVYGKDYKDDKSIVQIYAPVVKK